jgi:hypothetical protein
MPRYFNRAVAAPHRIAESTESSTQPHADGHRVWTDALNALGALASPLTNSDEPERINKNIRIWVICAGVEDRQGAASDASPRCWSGGSGSGLSLDP